jgi:hypothetical protein
MKKPSKSPPGGLRLLRLFVPLLFLSQLSFAQDLDQGLRFGAKAGANLNQFTQPGTIIDFNVGAMLGIQFSEIIGIRAELLYSGLGGGLENFTRDLSDIGGTVSSVTYLNRSVYMKNVELPVMLTFMLGSEGVVRPKILLGGSYAFMAATWEHNDKLYQFSNGMTGFYSNTVENITGQIQPHQFSVQGGISMEFDLGGKIFVHELRYRKGVNNVNVLRGIPGTGGELLPSTISLSFGLLF